MKDMKNIAKLITEMEQDMCNCYLDGEIIHLLKVDPEFVRVSLSAVMSDREHFTALGLVIGEA
jgi:hypothetical protein